MKFVTLISLAVLFIQASAETDKMFDILHRLAKMEQTIKDQNQKIHTLESKSCHNSAGNTAKRQLQGGIAFLVRLTRDLPDTFTNNIIKMQQVKLNEGNGYNSSSGIFTCPETGLYLFSWTLESMNFQLANICLNVNGNSVQSTFADLNPHHFQSSSGTELVRLIEGDFVSLKSCNGYHSYIDDIETYFLGVRLSE